MKRTLNLLSVLVRTGKIAGVSRLLPVAAVSLCLACAARGPAVTTDLDQLSNPAATEYNALEVAELNGKFSEAFTAAPDYQDYVIGGGDLIQISIFDAPDLSTETRVGARGGVTLPLLSTVAIAGLSVREAEQHVERLYREKYLQDPHVTIFVREQFGSKITMLGALKKPGAYDYYAKMNLLDVLAMAEGLSDAAGRTVQIRRKAESGESSLVIDLDQMIKDGRQDLNVGIKGGDIVYVPEAGSVYVDGAVRRAGAYPIRQQMSVQEAVVAAGGLQPFADSKDVKLIRYLGKGRREVARLSLEDLQSHETHGLKVRDRDVIFVESSAASTFFQGVGLTLRTGIFGFGYTPPTR
ncbi:MAG: polysaccharide export protein [Desulfomicrobium sp.]|nr:polysaccharide export protein [Pseudomonadota bacterium]MBV1713664.1 polysaccharide export protein [Desulfomicrobium sp.]MBU4572200.1 polysaccharide export protein [Pseudomonadota bacterium]MBU4594178.1 polysaccharide export protein [Pseudomonadota bacterium]MBV1720871.1 polysaccharide export protein [Desulfomicrobium sp.]